MFILLLFNSTIHQYVHRRENFHSGKCGRDLGLKPIKHRHHTSFPFLDQRLECVWKHVCWLSVPQLCSALCLSNPAGVSWFASPPCWPASVWERTPHPSDPASEFLVRSCSSAPGRITCAPSKSDAWEANTQLTQARATQLLEIGVVRLSRLLHSAYYCSHTNRAERLGPRPHKAKYIHTHKRARDSINICLL